jgi:hypothetical protein
MSKHVHRYWRTTDLYLAAFLFARGAIVVGIEADQEHAEFSFLDTSERQTWHDEYKSGNPMIDARIYAYAVSDLQIKGRHAIVQANETDRP